MKIPKFLTDAKDWCKDKYTNKRGFRWASWIFGGTTLASLALWGGYTISNRIKDSRGEIIYSGNLEGIGRVSYLENVGRNEEERNVLEIKRGRTAYLLTDEDGISLEWDGPTTRPFEDDVESIYFNDGKIEREFRRDQVSDGTYESEAIENMFKEADAKYNRAREKIRENKRTETDKTITRIREILRD